MPVAFNDVAAERAFCERCAFVRAEIFDGEEFAARVVEGEFSAVRECHGCAATVGHFFRAPDRDTQTCARWLLDI